MDLKDRYSQSRLPHALLITGQAGLGKFWLAETLAKALLCETQNACGECKGCQLLSAGSHPDYRVITLEEDSQQIKIEQIRSVINWVNQTSQMNGAKVSIISPAHKMNRNSANALLKVMEEPPAGTHLILVSDDPALLLPTIRSRAQQILVSVPSPDVSLAWLESEGELGQDWPTLLSVSGGSPLLALEQAANDSLKTRQIYASLWSDLWNKRKDIVELAASAQKLELTEVLLMALALLSDVARFQATGNKNSLNNKDVEKSILELSSRLSKQQVLFYLSRIEKSYRLAKGTQNPNATLLLESLMTDCLKAPEGAFSV